MKRMTFEALLLIFAWVLAISTDWSWYACVFAIGASVLMLIDVVPKLRGRFHESKKNKD
jgi:hypothetical protein